MAVENVSRPRFTHGGARVGAGRKLGVPNRLAVLSKICPPPGKVVKTVAVARSEEHVFNLRGGRVNKSGKPIEAPGNSYTLNPSGQPHSAMIATENIALVIYSGETDDVKSVEIVDTEPPLEEVA